MKKISFCCGPPHLDLIFHFEESGINAGYSYHLNFLAMFWLHNIQTGNREVFSKYSQELISKPLDFMDLRNHESSEELEKTLQNSLRIASLCPLPEDKFNLESALSAVNYFQDGSFRRGYEFVLKHKDLLLIQTDIETRKKEQVLTFSQTDSQEVCNEYVNFAFKESNMGVYQQQVLKLAKELMHF